MIVELNDKEFAKSHNGDIFIIEEKNGKKYAKPISKKELLNDVYLKLENAQCEILTFQEMVDEQNKKINEFKEFITGKLVQIAKIVGGKTNE